MVGICRWWLLASCDRAFLLVGAAAVGNSAVQICAVGIAASVLGIVNNGVSHRENGDGGSYRMIRDDSVDGRYGGEVVGGGGDITSGGGGREGVTGCTDGVAGSVVPLALRLL